MMQIMHKYIFMLYKHLLIHLFYNSRTQIILFYFNVDTK